MITEDYVSFETAKLLKEKGFDVKCLTYFISDNEIATILTRRDFNNNGIYLSAPTIQMAMKWLREEKKLSIIIDICFDDDRDRQPGYFFDIWRLTPPYESLETPHPVFDTYEEACEAAIKFCLENLI